MLIYCAIRSVVLCTFVELRWLVLAEGGCEGQLFFWSDGTGTDYMNWAQGEPNDWNAQDQTTCGGGANGARKQCDVSHCAMCARLLFTIRAVAHQMLRPTSQQLRVLTCCVTLPLCVQARTALSCSRRAPRASAPGRTVATKRERPGSGMMRCATWRIRMCVALLRH